MTIEHDINTPDATVIAVPYDLKARLERSDLIGTSKQMMMASEIYFDAQTATFILLLSKGNGQHKVQAIGHRETHRIVFSEPGDTQEPKVIGFATLKGSILQVKLGKSKPFTFFVNPLDPCFVHLETHLGASLGEQQPLVHTPPEQDQRLENPPMKPLVIVLPGYQSKSANDEDLADGDFTDKDLKILRGEIKIPPKWDGSQPAGNGKSASGKKRRKR